MTVPVRPSRETIGERSRTHGHSVGRKISPTYQSWLNMMQRCTNPKVKRYRDYGARGISVYLQWRKFDGFLADMGERPSLRHSIDRYPNKDGNYEPGNCRWATAKEQNRNKKSCRPVIRSDGLRFESIIEAAEATGGNRCCIRDTCAGRQKSHLGFTWRFAE